MTSLQHAGGRGEEVHQLQVLEGSYMTLAQDRSTMKDRADHLKTVASSFLKIRLDVILLSPWGIFLDFVYSAASQK